MSGPSDPHITPPSDPIGVPPEFSREPPHIATPAPQEYYQSPTTSAVPSAAKLQSDSTLVLVLGIVSLFFGGVILGIPAWVWGNSLIKQAEDARLSPDVVGNAKIGKILGIISTLAWIIGIAIMIALFFMFALVVSTSSPTPTPTFY